MDTRLLSRPLPLFSWFLLALLLGSSAPALAQDAPSSEPESEPPQEEPPAPPVRPRGGADPSDDAFRMGSPPALPEGVTEEEMWPAATAEGWRKPCLVHWQRTFDDALRVARAQNRPILVAVNMDGEIASEHFAGVRYREPETATQMSRYVCVVASVYRHTPRDYDEEGRRVECPRFGTVTCGEHIQAERDLYERYFDGTRVAPRHIVLDVDGTETYDVYYSWDTATVFTTFRKGIEGWPEPIEPGEPTLGILVASADVADRETIEEEYEEGDRETKRTILRALLEERAVDQVEVLRAAVFGLDTELSDLARRALALCETEGALDLMAEALKAPLAPADRQLLMEAVERLAATSPRARTLAALHSGLSLDSRHIDAKAVQALKLEYEASAAHTVDVGARARAAEARPNEPGALLDLAEAMLARALESRQDPYAPLWLEDARSAARDAEGAGAGGARLDAILAVVAAELGDLDTARARAVAAVEGGLLRLDDGAGTIETSGPGEIAKAHVLRLFAEARRRSIREAYRAGEEWPPEWLSDLNAAHSILAEGPLADESLLANQHDFLRWIGATSRASSVLEDALRRFPDSALLHERLRARLLYEDGPEGLLRGYAERLAAEEDADASHITQDTQITWYAGYASLVAAEHHRRRGEFDSATAAYASGIEHFEHNIELFPDGRDNCDHFIALAHAGGARVALERGDLDGATRELLTALDLRPDSAATQDGLGITPVATAKMLKARLLDAGEEGRAALVQKALDELDPRLLEPPPSELPGPTRRGQRGRRRTG